jgi:hypothetical protein
MSVSEAVPPQQERAWHAARTRFWNTLSKVWLTPSALREFDRRTAQSFEQRCTSDVERRSRKRPFVDISHLSAASLKRFGRRGGPSLADLRGVSQAAIRWEDEFLCASLSVSRPITSNHQKPRALLGPTPGSRSSGASQAILLAPPIPARLLSRRLTIATSSKSVSIMAYLCLGKPLSQTIGKSCKKG